MRPRDGSFVGLMRVRSHCVFTWVDPGNGDGRYVELWTRHCAPCVAELRERGYRLVQVPTRHASADEPLERDTDSASPT